MADIVCNVSSSCLACRWLYHRPMEWRDRRELNLTADVKSAAQRVAAELGVSPDVVAELATQIAVDASGVVIQ